MNSCFLEVGNGGLVVVDIVRGAETAEGSGLKVGQSIPLR